MPHKYFKNIFCLRGFQKKTSFSMVFYANLSGSLGPEKKVPLPLTSAVWGGGVLALFIP
jgi:hypothetical protein